MTPTLPLRLLCLAAASLAASGALAVESRVRIGLQVLQPGASVVTFGLPLAPGALADPAKIRVVTYPGNTPIAGVRTRTLLSHYDTQGAVTGVRSVLVQFPAAAMGGTTATVEVVVDGPADAQAGTQTFAANAFASPEVVQTTDRLVTLNGGTYSFTESNVQSRTLHSGFEPRILATYPDGYLASTGILGEQLTRAELARKPKLSGLQYLSDELGLFTTSMAYAEGYRMHPASVYDQTNYEGWLYDRCATYLTSYAHAGSVPLYRYALRACSYYAGAIGTSGGYFGIFTGKPSADIKYSHLRGLYAYYALTGDETAFTAGSNMAAMWNAESFVTAYRAGRTEGATSLWTERLLATSLEGLVYGFALTGNATYRTAAVQMFETAYRHITTTNQTELNAITRALSSFPPQNCWIHSAEQHAEGTATEPWCSSWMSELIIDPLRAYQDLTGDGRVDEIFVRLGRFVRDVGTAYFRGDILANTRFLAPQNSCYDANDTSNFRRLVPAYGSGIAAGGAIQSFADFADYEHCVDASALMAAATRSLIKQGGYGYAYNVGPFQTEGQSFLALFHEFSVCAKANFRDYHRTNRDPRTWTSGQLAAAYFGGNATQQASWMAANRIGYPSYPSDPQRKLSWWFNMSMLGLEMLDWSGLTVTDLKAGFVQGSGCAQPATPVPSTLPTVAANGKANQSIAAGTPLQLPSAGSTAYLDATASSGLLVAYTSLTPATCTASGNLVTALADGACTIALDQGGSRTYNAAPRVLRGTLVGPGWAADDDNDGIPAGAEAAEGTNPLAKDNDIFANGRLFAMQQYRDFLGREGDEAGIASWAAAVSGGGWTRRQAIDGFLKSGEFAGVVAPVARLYFATFLRVPEYAGLMHNAGVLRSGAATLAQLADFFTTSAEFQATYGALTNTQFVTLLYNNVLGRAPDAAGLNGWVSQLNGGTTRGQVLVGFAESAEFRAAIANDVFVTMMYAGMLRRSADPAGFGAWVAQLDSGSASQEQVIDGFFLSAEYRARFLP